MNTLNQTTGGPQNVNSLLDMVLKLPQDERKHILEVLLKVEQGEQNAIAEVSLYANCKTQDELSMSIKQVRQNECAQLPKLQSGCGLPKVPRK